MKTILFFAIAFLFSQMCISENARAAAANPQMRRKQMQQKAMQMAQMKKMMEMKQAQATGQLNVEGMPGSDVPAPSLLSEDTSLPSSPQEIKEKIDLVTKSSREWLNLSAGMRDLVVDYMMNQFKDRGAVFDTSASTYRNQIDDLVKADPKILDQRTLPELLQIVAALDPSIVELVEPKK
jgi:hypothetical protein